MEQRLDRLAQRVADSGLVAMSFWREAIGVVHRLPVRIRPTGWTRLALRWARRWVSLPASWPQPS